jgi:hypothetical protein
MSVYVDPLFDHEGSTTFRWKRSCHMYADSLVELHAMAANIGMKRAWFQDKLTLPHYDLVPLRRVAAVKLGAIEQTQDEMVKFMRDNRARLIQPGLVGWTPIDETFETSTFYGRTMQVISEMVIAEDGTLKLTDPTHYRVKP